MTEPVFKLRWKLHSDDFASLMLGRVQVAQISRGTSGNWYWHLFFCRPPERESYGDASRDVAIAEAESHARKILSEPLD